MKMNKTQKAYRAMVLEYTKSKMATLVKLRDTKSPPLPELPDDIYYIDNGDNRCLTIGFSPDNVRLVWELMFDAGWENPNTTDEIIAEMKSGKTTTKYTYWSHENDNVPNFGIWVMVGSKGSNCERVKIGTETVEKDIYEVVCNDGIAEVEGDE